MSRKPRVQRTVEEKWEIVQEGIKSGNVSETCRRYGIVPNLYYRWKDEAEQGRSALFRNHLFSTRPVCLWKCDYPSHLLPRWRQGFLTTERRPS
jgi:hypothetical protein